MEEEKQAIAYGGENIHKEAFDSMDTTVVRWLGNGGAMINSRGTCIMIDPLLKGFDMPLLVEPPILPEDVPGLDAVLITHCDNDHFSRVTCRELSRVCPMVHAPHYVAGLLREEKIASTGHDINESFLVGNMKVTLTPADHAWQNSRPKYAARVFKLEDYCGFRIETEDGTIWMPGDSRLMQEQLNMPHPDVILLDFSDSKWHIGLEGVKKLTAAYTDAILIPIHWGCVDAPAMAEFNGDPKVLKSLILNPERICMLAPGESFDLKQGGIGDGQE